MNGDEWKPKHFDEDGREYVLTENGERMPAPRSKKISKEGEFTQYDTSQGHCGFCGSLTCRGTCFK